MADGRKTYQQKSVLWKANVDTLISEIQKDLKKYEKESASMTAKERDLSRQLIQTKQQQLGDYQKATNEKAAQEDNQLTKQVIDEINQFIKDYGKKNSFKIILAATSRVNDQIFSSKRAIRLSLVHWSVPGCTRQGEWKQTSGGNY